MSNTDESPFVLIFLVIIVFGLIMAVLSIVVTLLLFVLGIILIIAYFGSRDEKEKEEPDNLEARFKRAEYERDIRESCETSAVQSEECTVCEPLATEIITQRGLRFKKSDIIAGEAFEEYVLGMFSKENFTVLNHTPSFFVPHSTQKEVEQPDLLISDNTTGQVFYVECKFRSRLKENRIEWADMKHKKIYERYRDDSGYKVYIAIGFRGKPTNPKQIFFIDLDEIDFPSLYRSFCNRYEIPTKCTISSISEIPYYS